MVEVSTVDWGRFIRFVRLLRDVYCSFSSVFVSLFIDSIEFVAIAAS